MKEKNKRFRKLILLICILSGMNLHVQGQILDVPKMVPISPNAASLGQFGTYPVGTYTGLPGISIPLYEIELDGRKIPISLSYNASGIKVAQEAGLVGLGWSLNAGGIITKEIRGWNDFHKNNQTYPDRTIPDDPGYYYNTWPQWPACDANNNPIPGAADDLIEILASKDTQPDMFHFNFGGYTGTMFFERKPGDRSNIVKPYILTPTEYLDISYHLDTSSWVIIDPYGYKYTFTDKEWTELRTASTEYFNNSYTTNKNLLNRRNKMPHIETAWVLNSIESPYGNKVTFSYTTERVSTPILLSEPLLMSIPIVANYPIGSPTIKSYDYSFSFIIQKTLSRIEFGGGSVVFSKSGRSDLDGTIPSGSAINDLSGAINPQKLDMLQVKDKAGNSVKKIAFGYEYMGNTSSYLKCRLMLKSITDTDGASNPITHKFAYASGTLPDKNSLATDLWGYHNASPLTNINQTLPTMLQDANYNNPYGYPYGLTIGGKSVVPSATHMQYGTLESIEYPTKGKTKFIYEPHKFYDSFRCSITSYPANVTTHDPTYPVHANSGQITGSEFKLLEGTYVSMKVFYHNMSGTAIPAHNVRIEFEKKLSSNQFGTVNRLFINMNQSDGERNEQMVYLPAGEYRTTIIKERDQYNNIKPCGYYISVTMNSHKPYVLNQGGGLRIKEIQNLEGSTILTRKKYKYERNGETTGRLIVKPDCANLGLFDTRNSTTLQELTTIAMLTNNQTAYGYVTPYISLNGNPSNIGYSYVEESVENAQGGTIGKTTYTYFNERTRDKILLPGFPHQIHPGNGSLLEICEYNASGSIAKKTTREYSKKTVTGANNVKALVLHSVLGVARIGGKFYDLKSERWSLDKETTTLYNDNGTNNIVTTTNYQYHPTYWTVNKEQSTDSKNQTVETRIKFAGDYSDAVHTKMRTKNMTGIPIETIRMSNNEVVSGSKTIYQDVSGMILPKEAQILETITPSTPSAYTGLFKTHASFEKYNAKGKLLQARGKDNKPVTYLWTYGSEYLIAEIKNATYQEVETAATALGLNLNTLANSTSPDMSKVDALRDRLTKAHISTFTCKPLVGVTSITDPGKMVTSFSYDTYGRLKETYITESGLKHVLEYYKYNHKSQ